MALARKKALTQPPLKEVIFEVRWDNSQIPETIRRDSRVLAGILSEKVKDDYGFYEPLELSKLPIPEDSVKGIVQYRFRVAENSWPLMQIGPGVLSVNDVAGYVWEDFKTRTVKAVADLISTYSIGEAVSSVNLRYLNTIPFDFDTNNVHEYLETEMGIHAGLPADLFTETSVKSAPSTFSIKSTYVCTEPAGAITITFASGKDSGKDVLVWEISFISTNADNRNILDELDPWLESCHEKIEAFFFTLGQKILK